MVLINNTKIEIYEFDTMLTIFERIASMMKTVSKYIYFINGIPKTITDFNTKESIEVIDLLKIIKKGGTSFLDVYLELKDKIGQQNLDLYNDIFVVFISFNKNLEDENVREFYLLNIIVEIEANNIFPNKKIDITNINNVWTNRNKIINNINFEIRKNYEVVNDYINNIEKIKSVKKLDFTSFELERIGFELILDIADKTILDIFNSIRLNDKVPFASINNIYKIFKKFIPYTEWNDLYLEDVIVFKVLQKKILDDIKESDFIDAFLVMKGDVGNEKVSVGMTYTSSTKHISKNELIKQFIDTIELGLGKVQIEDTYIDNIKGNYYVPNHRINKYILADIILNNSFFSSMFSVDDSTKATKNKDSLYIYFENPTFGNVNVNITEKYIEKYDRKFLRGKDINLFQIGTYYIRVRISVASSMESIKHFQNIFSKLLAVYDNEYNNIVDFYRSYIPKFAISKQKKTIKLKNIKPPKLKQIAPEIFIEGYPQKCTNQPTIISDDEVENAKKSGKRVMVFPKNNNEGITQRNYICEHENYIYPGLRKNPLRNKNKVPYLPCCYEKDREEQKGGIYRHYYYGEPLEKTSEKIQQDIIITNKFVVNDNYGELPENLSKLFKSLDPDENFKYFRKGVFDNKSSFLDCVMEGLYEETEILKYDTKSKREQQLKNMRQLFAKSQFASACKQEMYDYTIDDIVNYIVDWDKYFTPHFFTSLLEKYFKCNIYIFNRNSKTNESELLIPRHMECYYSSKNYPKTIFIYQHSGSTSDHALYPRCELIVRWKIKGKEETDVEYSFDSKLKLCVEMKKIFNELNESFSLNKKNNDINFPIKNQENVEFYAQHIDSYGKTRIIFFKYENQKGSIITTPVSPFILPYHEEKIYKLNSDIVFRFANKIGIIITGQTVVNNILKEINGMLGNISIVIPVHNSDTITTIVPVLKRGESSLYTDNKNQTSIIDNYIKYNKLSKYIVEYTYWLYSNYLQETKQNISLDTILDFFNKNIEIDTNFEYGKIEQKFSNKNKSIIKNGKLIVNSDELLKRLIYTLQLYIQNNRNAILEYYKRKIIENYYINITDFDNFQSQIILQGDNSVNKWINEQNLKYLLYNSIQINSNEPYFFRNEIINNEIFLAQNTESIKKGLQIIDIWFKYKYNPVNVENNNSNIKKYSYTFYKYINPTNIKKYKVNGKKSYVNNINIIGYKTNDDSTLKFTVLLPL